MQIKINKLELERFNYLKKLYEVTNGDTRSVVNMEDVGNAINYDKELTSKVVQYLSNEELLKSVTIGGGISITHNGIKYIEAKSDELEDIISNINMDTPEAVKEEEISSSDDNVESLNYNVDKDIPTFLRNLYKDDVDKNRSSTISNIALSDKAIAIEDDALDYAIYADALVDFLAHPQTEPPFSLAITGSWGCGKTTLMKWIRDKMTSKGYPTTWFAAWRYNKHEEIWAAFAKQIIKDTLTFRLKVKLGIYRFTDALLIPIKYYKYLAYALVLAVLTFTILFLAGQVTIKSIHYLYLAIAAISLPLVTLVKPVIKMLQNPFNKIYVISKGPLYDKQLGFQNEFECDFARLIRLVSTKEKPLIIFIDDLDRAPAPLPVEVIESMNVLLNQHNCNFILGLDLPMVAASIEAKYSVVIDRLNNNKVTANYFSGNDFLDKLIQMNFNIPTPTDHQMNTFIDSIFEKNKSNKSNSVPDNNRKETSNNLKKEEEITKFVEEYGERNDIHILTKYYSQYMPNNPRKIKRFVNTFRLMSFIAKRRNMITDSIEELNIIAAITVVAVEYPEVYSVLLASDYKDQLNDGKYEALICNKTKANRCNAKELFSIINNINDINSYLSLFTVIESGKLVMPSFQVNPIFNVPELHTEQT